MIRINPTDTRPAWPAGHTAVAHFLPHADPLYKVTIILRGRARGVTHTLPEEECHTLPEPTNLLEHPGAA